MTKEEEKTLKDLGLVVATKEEAFWKKAFDESKITVEKLENATKFEKAVLAMIELKLKEISS